MHNAGEAFGLPLRRPTVMTQNNDDYVDMQTRHASSATAAATTNARKEVVDTAKALVPVAVEFEVLDTLARYFN
jgi:hypothetical protein